MKEIVVKDKVINITGISDDDYVSLTDIARIKNSKFRGVEFDPLLKESGKNLFTMLPTRWINEFNAIRINT